MLSDKVVEERRTKPFYGLHTALTTEVITLFMKICLWKQIDLLFQEIQFEVVDVTKREYKPERFNIIYCTDAISSVFDKLCLFRKFHVSVLFTLRKHAFIILTPFNPTFI